MKNNFKKLLESEIITEDISQAKKDYADLQKGLKSFMTKYPDVSGSVILAVSLATDQLKAAKKFLK